MKPIFILFLNPFLQLGTLFNVYSYKNRNTFKSFCLMFHAILLVVQANIDFIAKVYYFVVICLPEALVST